MPGIEDVQPKQISTLGQPIVSPIEAVVTPASTLPVLDVINRQRDAAVQAVDYGFNAPVVAAARKVALAQAPLQIAQAQKGIATLNTGDLVQKHLAYSTPIVGPDGKPDYSAMAESGMNYRRAEMMLQYAQSGLTALPPIDSIDPKTGLPVKVYKNAFGENPFDEKVQDRYHKLRDAASQTLMGKPQINSSWHPSDLVKQSPPEGGAAGIPHSSHQVQVTPPNTDVSGMVLPAAPVTSVEVPAESIQPTVALPAPTQVVAPAPVVAPVAQIMQGYRKPIPLGQPGNPFDAAAAVAAYTEPAVVAKPIVYPNTVADQQPSAAAPYASSTAPVTVSTPNHTVTVQPKPAPVATAPAPAQIQLPDGMVQTPAGVGFPSGSTRAAADKLVDDARKTDYVSGWSKVKDVVNEFNSVKQAYEGAKEKGITSQKDVALANTLIRLQNPAGTGRGFGELKVENLEKDAPRLEQLLHIRGLVLREHAFTPETRKRLIEEGNRLVKSIEDPARSEMTRVASRVQDLGRPLSDHFNSDELSLLGQGSSAPASQGATGPVRVLRDGTRVRIKQ